MESIPSFPSSSSSSSPSSSGGGGTAGTLENSRPLPTLKTGRSILKVPDPSEAEAVVNYYKKNREHLINLGPAWPADFLTVAYWENELQKNQREFQDDRSLRFFLFDRANPEVVVGSANLSNVVRSAA
ncbi:MAG: hypothetical protein KGS72_20670, partial [Cyanobacteria bacterium REEB67]|nr:hypothetical protein [Cyanobacteria bacterium REEB67]